MAQKYVRVKPPVSVLRHPEHGGMVAPDPALPYSVDDPLVKAFPWQFQSDDDAADPASVVTEVKVERATRAPGERRQTRR